MPRPLPTAPLRLLATLGVLAGGIPTAGCGPGLASAQEPEPVEEILSYDVTLQLHGDGWLDVTERIRVRAAGEDIRRGIYRDFPTSFPGGGWFQRVNAPFEVTRVLRDGKAEPYVVESVGGPARRGGIRVRIGDADTLLDPGIHSYDLSYRTHRWIQYGDEADRLSWNVTGNGWAFPIREASMEIMLPDAVAAEGVDLEGWTGPEGSTESDLTTSYTLADGRSRAVFETTAPLDRREGLTVRITFPKGVVEPPTQAQRRSWFLLDWGPWLDVATVLALVLAVYLLLWNRVGRDPRSRPVMVRYEPPEGFSPAALGYLVQRGWKSRHLAATLVSLAVAGRLTIERDGGDWILRGTPGSAGDGEPATGERIVLDPLLGEGGDGTLRLDGSSTPEVRDAVKALRKHLSATLEKRYFLNNRGWFAVGLAVTLAGLAALAWRVRFTLSPDVWFMAFWLTLWTIGTGTLIWRVGSLWRRALAGETRLWIGALFLTLFSVPFVGAEVVVGWMLAHSVALHLVVATLGLGVTNVLFYHLLERPTLLGRGVLDRVEGYRHFLQATEGDRIRRLQPAEASLQLFERHLPWAIALDVESAWAARFEAVLDAPDSGPRSGAIPAWYLGTDGGSTSSLGSSLGSGLSSSLSSASSAPSSSGGGGGGGFSGGGGGGGGGGGW